MATVRPARHAFRASGARSSEPLALDRRVFAFAAFDVPPPCQYVPEEVEGGVAVLAIIGPLEHRTSWVWSSYEEIAQQVEAAFADERVGAVVLKIDSPGGIAAGMGEMHKSLRAMRVGYGKPLYAYVDEQACSAAYHLASACDEIWLPESGEAGSVGVILCTVDETKALDQQGIAVRYVVTGGRKADMHPGTEITDEVLTVAQEKVDYLGTLFFAAVAKARRMTPAAVEALDAGVFQGQKAVEKGLADGVSSWAEFISTVRDTCARTDTHSASMGQGPKRASSTEAKSMSKLLQLQMAATNAKAEVDTAKKALAKMPTSEKAMARVEAALRTKISADSALSAIAVEAKRSKVTEKYSEKKERVVEDDESEDADEEAEAEAEEDEKAEASDAGSSTGGSEASSTGGSDSAEEEEEEKAAAKAFHAGGAGLHTPARMLRLAKEVVEKATGARPSSIRETMGALDAIGQRLAKTAGLEKRLAKLETERTTEKVNAMLAKAETEGRIQKSQVPSLRAQGLKDRAALKGFLAASPKQYRTTAEGDAFVPRMDAEGNPVGGAPSRDEQAILATLTVGMNAEQAAKAIATYQARIKSNGAATPKH